MICNNIGEKDGHLTFAGFDTTKLSEKYGTPLYLMDENKIREKIRIYKKAMAEYFKNGSFPVYASKACSFKHIYEIMKEENMAVDLVSPGEIFTAKKAGFPMENALFHGNNKTDSDISFAMDCGVGYFVADNIDELSAINRIAKEKNITQNVILRLSPGIDPHTYEAVSTGKVDSKFGVAIETGQAALMVRDALSFSNIHLSGYHCHVGSQVFNEDGNVYIDAASIMFEFAFEMSKEYGYNAEIMNMGGGFGVRYTEDDPQLDIDLNIKLLAQHISSLCEKYSLKCPKILMEPGRSIVADSGMTLYSVGTVKEITGYKNYVSIDGGMTDNPRYALYGSKYTVLLANRINEEKNFVCDVVGRCCESGDIIQPCVSMPKPKRNDLIAVLTTGAYNYSMSSNYNRIARPAVVMLKDGKDSIAVKRESFEHLTALDV